MNILALDTSMGVCAAAVSGAPDETPRRVFVRETEMPRGHAEALMPMIEDVLKEAQVEARDLDLIAATLGPGSFTGVRIAIAAARGLALVSKAALFGSDSLTVMARAALSAGVRPDGPYAVAVDARRGMLYLGLYDEAGRRLDGPRLCAPDEAVRLLPETLLLAVGNGAETLAEPVRVRGRTLATALPSLQPGAAALAALAGASEERTRILRPLYLRKPDAKPQNAHVARRAKLEWR